MKNGLNDVLDWIRSTDIVEVEYKQAGKGFSFSTAPEPAPHAYGAKKFAAVPSQEVGFFRFNQPGKSRPVADDAAVEAGALLGYVEGAKGLTKVAAPAAGRLARTCVDDGQPVQYGQPLFFIEIA